MRVAKLRRLVRRRGIRGVVQFAVVMLLYKLGEHRALGWIDTKVEGHAGTLVGLFLEYFPIISWVFAALLLVWIIEKNISRVSPQGDDVPTNPKAIAYLKGIMMTALPEKVDVICSLAFYFLDRAEPSPTELIVKSHDTHRIICRLKAPTAPSLVDSGRWTLLPYYGEVSLGDSAALRAAIEATMHALPSDSPVFVDLEVALPDGAALAMHDKSGVRFGTSPGVAGPEVATVKIANWEQGIQGAWRTVWPVKAKPRFELIFDRDDPECQSQWPETRHTLFRVRLRNLTQDTPISNVAVKVEDIVPPLPAVRGATLLVRHQEDVLRGSSLPPEESWYVDVVEFNARDATTQQSLLLLWTAVPNHSTPLPVRNYDFTLAAYGNESPSVRGTFRFTIDSVGYEFRQLGE